MGFRRPASATGFAVVMSWFGGDKTVGRYPVFFYAVIKMSLWRTAWRYHPYAFVLYKIYLFDSHVSLLIILFNGCGLEVAGDGEE